MMLMIAQNSWWMILPFFLVSIIGFIDRRLLLLAIPFVVFGIFLVYFFRDPRRIVQLDESVIYSAADGVVLYTEITENTCKVAVRMSPFDVHIIRAPQSARITQTLRQAGKHMNVYFARVEEENERMLLKLATVQTSIDLLLITGAFARRIEIWSGSTVQQGDKIGIIRFGSQTNIFVKSIKPLQLLVDKGDKVKAGLTPIIKIE